MNRGCPEFPTVCLCVALLTAMVFGTMIRNETWRSEQLLWQDVVDKSPENPVGYLNLAREYHRNGNKQRAFELYQDAMNFASMRTDFKSRDTMALAQANMGALLLSTGKPEDREMGIRALKASMSLFPYYAPAVIWLSSAYNDERRYSETISMIDSTLQHGFGAGFLVPGVLFFNKGVALCGLGFIQQANENFDHASRMDADIQPAACGIERGF